MDEPPETVGDLPLFAPQKPTPTLTAEVSKRFVQRADRAEVWLTVSGSRFVTGHAALKQAEEVAAVVAAAESAGVPKSDVHLADASVNSKSGVITTVTAATYTLRIDLADLSKLADLLTAATAPKGCELTDVVYRFDEDPAVRDGWLGEVVAAARRRAGVLAGAAGVAVGDVQSVFHSIITLRPEEAPDMDLDQMEGGRGRRRLLYGSRRDAPEPTPADLLPGAVERERAVVVTAGLRVELRN